MRRYEYTACRTNPSPRRCAGRPGLGGRTGDRGASGQWRQPLRHARRAQCGHDDGLHRAGRAGDRHALRHARSGVILYLSSKVASVGTGCRATCYYSQLRPARSSGRSSNDMRICRQQGASGARSGGTVRVSPRTRGGRRWRVPGRPRRPGLHRRNRRARPAGPRSGRRGLEWLGDNIDPDANAPRRRVSARRQPRQGTGHPDREEADHRAPTH